jgi:hypothetical protein
MTACRANLASAVDGGIPLRFNIGRTRPAATDPHCAVLTLMKRLFAIAAVAAATIHSGAAESSKPALVFREPFTLKLHVDKEHYYEESFGKIPYVADNDVYLFKGDAFGVDLLITNGVISGIAYQAETNKASMTFHFTQEAKGDGGAMMLLVIKNQSKHKVFMDALMTVPGKKGLLKTSILPVEPKLSGYESWPEPIVQLVLRNIRLTEKPGTEPSGPANGSQPVRSETNRTPPAAGSRR